jgi:hypothetical protein
MKKHDGFAFALVFRNEDTNETFEVSIWEDEDALRESEKEGGVVEWKTNMLESAPRPVPRTWFPSPANRRGHARGTSPLLP